LAVALTAIAAARSENLRKLLVGGHLEWGKSPAQN